MRLILLHVGVLGEGESGVCRPSVSTGTTRWSVQLSIYAFKRRKERTKPEKRKGRRFINILMLIVSHTC